MGEAIIGAPVLDLFAGSGALGIEALSRGAASAIFVEHDRESAEAIEKNLAKTKLKGRVRRQNVFDFLRQRSNSGKFKIIFADPPYEKDYRGKSHAETLLNNKSLSHLLEPNGVFVLEKKPTDTFPQTNLWRILRQKTYGATEVLFLEPTCN